MWRLVHQSVQLVAEASTPGTTSVHVAQFRPFKKPLEPPVQ
jgi:hypothetical protein